MKCCGRCKITKPFSEFNKHKGRKDGLQVTCKTCLKDYADAHKEEKAIYYQQNKEQRIEYSVAWKKANPEAVIGYEARRRSLAKLSMSKSDMHKSAAYRKKIKDNPCYYCGEIKEKMQDDHYYPLARGGTDHWWNLVRSCEDCNQHKGTMLGSKFEEVTGCHF